MWPNPSGQLWRLLSVQKNSLNQVRRVMQAMHESTYLPCVHELGYRLGSHDIQAACASMLSFVMEPRASEDEERYEECGYGEEYGEEEEEGHEEYEEGWDGGDYGYGRSYGGDYKGEMDYEHERMESGRGEAQGEMEYEYEAAHERGDYEHGWYWHEGENTGQAPFNHQYIHQPSGGEYSYTGQYNDDGQREA
ncbi:hypothetical protein FRC09_008275 [Ceratobasidium sp. 395]|nr:hypothetical protein FRC09_008275 [Ceratobasidium sp. 395]